MNFNLCRFLQGDDKIKMTAIKLLNFLSFAICEFSWFICLHFCFCFFTTGSPIIKTIYNINPEFYWWTTDVLYTMHRSIFTMTPQTSDDLVVWKVIVTWEIQWNIELRLYLFTVGKTMIRLRHCILLGALLLHTVLSESIHTPWPFPHFVVLQSEIKIY